MNIFQKIALINKIFKVIDIIKDFSGLSDIKEGKRLINEGIERIAKVVPDIKECAEKIKEA